jgi:ribosomal protein S18 acetylase RimI-like enzyme
MLVRPANPADAPFIARFNASLARETEAIELDPARLLAGVAAALEDPSKARYLIAESASLPIGQLMVTYEWSDWRNGFIWWIQSVWVEPAFRSQGVFRALYRSLEAEARAAGAAALRLYVETHNERAQRVYESMGMTRAPYFVYEKDFVVARP